jgi:hypothetical protein
MNDEKIKCELKGHSIKRYRGKVICDTCNKVIKERSIFSEYKWNLKGYNPKDLTNEDKIFFISFSLLTALLSFIFLGWLIPLTTAIFGKDNQIKVLYSIIYWNSLICIIMIVPVVLAWL